MRIPIIKTQNKRKIIEVRLPYIIKEKDIEKHIDVDLIKNKLSKQQGKHLSIKAKMQDKVYL